MPNPNANAPDLRVNQVLPGRTAGLGSVATNFGLTSSAFQALKSELQNISPNLVVNSNSVEDLRNLFKGLGLYAGGLSTGVANLPFVFSFQNLSKQFPGPAKLYTKNISRDRWVLPVPPADFNVSVPNSQTTVTSISGFNYTHAGPIELDEVSFEGFFPYIDASAPLPNFIPDYLNFSGGSVAPYAYHTPREWVEALVTAMRANQPLLFSVYATNSAGAPVTTAGGTVIEPVAMSVSSFDWDMGITVGGTRRDVSYKITLKRWRRQNIRITNYVSNPNYSGGSESNPNGSGGGSGLKIVTTPYKKANTLAKLAQLSPIKNAHRWREIYTLNKKKIDADYANYVRRRPSNQKQLNNYPISPGLRLKIPRN